MLAIAIGFGLNWLANSSERNLKHNLADANYEVVGTYCQGFGCNYVFMVSDCEFHASHAGPSDNMHIYRGVESNKKPGGTIVYTGNTQVKGEVIDGYTPETFMDS